MSTRKDFLATTPLFALAPAAATPPPGPSPAAHRPFDFDQARFEQILAKPARHRQCFGATKIDGGNVIDAMANSMNAYEKFLGEPAGSMHTVAVLYHNAAIAIAMSNTVWNEILLPSLDGAPEEIRKQFAHVKAGSGNPYLQPGWLPEIVSRGGSFFVCHNAIQGFSEMAASALKRPVHAVHAAIMKGIVAGALVVPAGVMAVNACQEAKFTYIQSSL